MALTCCASSQRLRTRVSTGRLTARHHAWGEGCEGWHLVETPDLSIVWEQMPPSTCESRHLHLRARHFFFVLRGALSVEVEGSHVKVAQGEGLHLAPALAHAARNDAEEPVEFLVVSQPPVEEDRDSVASAPRGRSTL